MPKKLSSVAEAMTAVKQIIGTSKESLKKILVRGEFDEFPDDKHMLCKARLVEMLNKRAGHYLIEKMNERSINWMTEIVEMEKLTDYTFGGLKKYSHVLLSQAFNLKMRMTTYCNVVLRSLLGPNNGGGIERMLEEPPSIAVKRQKLIKSIKKLEESKEVVCKIMDDRFNYAEYLV
ncbi:hypothetical protein L3X38_010208 [Prunus dulcis]|uniref:GED domain-containing protein n=1 Tax=Prunus dulcis TaxID=3755 RepID=A0AAD4WF34_PRUDU|nr:hypothetical protein L3X38_010208 [Prunus dulcis]